MPGLSQLMAKNLLDWSLHSATPSQPAGNFMGIASIAISSTATTGEWATAAGYARQTAAMTAASTPASSASAMNTAGITFGTVNTAIVASGCFLSDSVSSGAGTFLYWGSLAAARSLSSGDSLVFAASALGITLV